MHEPAGDEGPRPWAPPGGEPVPSAPPPVWAGNGPWDGSFPAQTPWGWGPPPPPQPKGGGRHTGPLPLHPMTVGDILDGAFKLLKANAKTLFTIVAVFVVPLQLLAAFAQRNVLGGAGFLDALNDPSLAEAGSDQPVADQLVSWSATLLNLVLLPFLAGAISQVVGASYLGEELGPGPALARTLRRAWALFASWVVVHVLELAALLALPIVAVVLAVLVDGPLRALFVLFAVVAFLAGIGAALGVMALSVAVAPAVVVEELGPIQGVRRSWSLLRRRFWAVLGIALLAGLISNVLGQVLGVVPTFAGLIVGLEWGWILLAVGAILTALVTTPIVAIVATLQYFDARIRFEGFDLQVIAAELGPTRAGV